MIKTQADLVVDVRQIVRRKDFLYVGYTPADQKIGTALRKKDRQNKDTVISAKY